MISILGQILGLNPAKFFLISASPQSQDQRNYLLLSPTSIHLPTSGRVAVLFRKELVILCYTFHPGKSICLWKVDTILGETFIEEKESASADSWVTCVLLGGLVMEEASFL